MKKVFFLIILISSSINAQTSLWNAVLETETQISIPFLFEIDSIQSSLYIINGEEKIYVEDFEFRADSLKFTMPVFGSTVSASISKNELAKRRLNKDVTNITGIWDKYPNKADYKMKFSAFQTTWEAWNTKSDRKPVNLNGKWAATFTEDDGSTYPAIAYFKQKGNILEGTFTTNTGDYRYLYGKVYDSKFYLSCFDGAHAFFFTGEYLDGNLYGTFHSGKTWSAQFTAQKDENATLDNPYELTYLNDGFEGVDFSFPEFGTNKNVSLSDKQFNNKAVVIQILGTWCPNCMDETDLYAKLSEEYKSKNVEFVAVAFELSEEMEKNNTAIEKYKEHFNLKYPILFGGAASKKIASEKFPMLNKIMSFPTTIVLDKNHKLVKIHTGFYGPATEEYDNFVENFVLLLDKISTNH